MIDALSDFQSEYPERFLFGASVAPFAKSLDYPEEEWESDFQKMKELNITAVRCYVAWDRVEQKEGELDFHAYDHLCDLGLKYGIGIILNLGGVFSCLTGVYPPQWLVRKYGCKPPKPTPTAVAENASPRISICLDNPLYRRKAFAFMETVVKRYAENRAVIGWMSWNEPALPFCYCQDTQKRFRKWLQDKYNGNLAELNRVWGTEFPINYESWEEVQAPAGFGFTGGGLNAWRDWHLFTHWRLADAMAHNHTSQSRRRRAAFSVPLLILADILILSVMWYVTLVVLKIRPTPQSFHTFLPLRVVPVFFALVAFRSYSTVWGRAMLSNYIRLILGVALGVLCSVVIIVLLGYNEGRTLAFPAIHFGLSLLLLMAVRSVRPFLRDFFYFVNARRLADDPEVSRVLVFGAGLRYRSFRRELVRKFLQEKRVIVGLVDDDILLRGKIIGGIRVDGPHMDARRIIAETRANAVVIACELPPERLRTVVETFKSCGVKVSHFNFSEQPL